jgi:hypothetical protein
MSAILVGLALSHLSPVPRPPAGFSVPAARAAVERALPVLWAGADGHSEHRTCFSCHHHAVPLVAFTTAKARGFAVPADKLRELVEFVVADVEHQRPRLHQGQGPGPSPVGGGADTTGHMLLALDVAGHEPDAATAAVVGFTLARDAGRDHWRTSGGRPPTEASSVTTTALAVRGLRRFGGPGHRDRIDARVANARAWLLAVEPKDTEDRVFRLLGLRAAGATDEQVTAAASDLLVTQRPDGGWGQTGRMASDAYATGTALYALRTAGGLPADAPAVRRGAGFLIGTQTGDGSWHVRTRSRPVQKYFETGFPHGKDQFLSCAATGWATAALALAVE